MAEYHWEGDAIGRCLPAGDLAEVLCVQDKLARAAVPDVGVAIPWRGRQGGREDAKRRGCGLPEASFRARIVARRVTARIPSISAPRLGDEAEEQKRTTDLAVEQANGRGDRWFL
jgi:hypothetical protein